MPKLSPANLSEIQDALREFDLDGWLLFDFRACNPIALQLIGIDKTLSRRICVFVPRDGLPMALSHHIEQDAWQGWPREWPRERYSAWVELEAWLKGRVHGKTIAMEYSPGDAVPYVDRIPGGVLDMVREAGATVQSSAALVSRFYATWTADLLAGHRRAAQLVAEIGQDALRFAGAEVRAGRQVCEHEVQTRIMAAFADAGLESYAPANVSAGPNAANPHYEPSAEHPQRIAANDVLLIDLWAKEPNGVYADQTWMAVLGEPSRKAQEIWAAIRDARDAAIAFIREALVSGRPLRGGDVDDAARAVIVERGFGPYFVHRTGHSIDQQAIHGSGPNLDNLETRDVRELMSGVGFSIEPGIYLPGEIGMRTEVNGYIDGRTLVITPAVYQHDLLVV